MNTFKKAASKNEEIKTRPENVVYIGPDRLMDGLKKFTIYRKRPDDFIKKKKEKYKSISRLFVPVNNLNKAMADMAKKGTPINLAYAQTERGE